MKNLLLLCFMTLISMTALCQEGGDQWEVYMAQYKEGAGSTMVNMSLRDKTPESRFRFLLITGVVFKNCADGFPTPTEFDRLYAVSDSVNNLLSASVDNIIAGTFTQGCERVDYIYVSDTANIRKKLTAMYKKRFPSYKPVIRIREDKAWEGYHQFLYPNEETREYISNSKVLLKLQEAGDLSDKPREIDHWLYFTTEKDREAFILFAQSLRFTVKGKETVKSARKTFKLHLSRPDKIDLAALSQLTLQLKKEAAKYNGDYDGWESAVVRQ